MGLDETDGDVVDAAGDDALVEAPVAAEAAEDAADVTFDVASDASFFESDEQPVSANAAAPTTAMPLSDVALSVFMISLSNVSCFTA